MYLNNFFRPIKDVRANFSYIIYSYIYIYIREYVVKTEMKEKTEVLNTTSPMRAQYFEQENV